MKQIAIWSLIVVVLIFLGFLAVEYWWPTFSPMEQ